MFRKPFHTKSCSNLRSSARRKIYSRVTDDVSKILGIEKNLYVKRVQVGLRLCNLYGGDKYPLLFEIDGDDTLYPTVYLLWLCPTSYPTLFVHETIFERLEGGADLMLPGLLHGYDMPKICVGDQVAIMLVGDNKITGPVAVGRALLSSPEMVASGMKGKAVQVLHCYKDLLWEFGDKSKAISYPEAQFQTILAKKNCIDTSTDEEFLPITNKNDDLAPISDINTTELLRKTFLAIVRYKVDAKSCEFPIDAGQFYATYVLKNWPVEIQLDLKKTKYKKFNKFLCEINNEYSDDWLVNVSTNKKGVDYINKLNFEHNAVKTAEFPLPTMRDTGKLIKSNKIHVSDCLSVTEAVMPFFRQFTDLPKMIRKGDVLQSKRIRELVWQYACDHNLNREKNKVELDDVMQMIMKHFLPDTFTVNDIVQRMGARMTKCFVIITEINGISHEKMCRGSMPFIALKIEKRSGNKLVTLISNLRLFNIDEKFLCQRIQIEQATGTSIIPNAPNCDGPQVLVHGNVINFVGDELINSYGLHKNFIKGLEFGVKKKK